MDEQYLLTTPENVPLQYELAGVGSRFVAALLDGVITLAVQIGLFVTAFLLYTATRPWREFGNWVFAVVLLLSFVVMLGYSLFFEIVLNGQTPGKLAVGIRVIQDSGHPLTATAAVIRNVVRLVDFLPAYYIIGTVVMLIDGRSRRLGDMAAGTICVKERRDVEASQLSAAAPASHENELAVGASLGNLARLSYADYQLVKEYLARRRQLGPEPAHSLAVRIATGIAAKIGHDLAEESAENFLLRVGVALERQRWR